MGDFNEILDHADVSKTTSWRSNLINQFRSVVQECGLFDLGFKGSKFTYSNRRMGSEETKCRLDRVLATAEWRRLFPYAKVVHLTTFHSDHVPLQLCLSDRVGKPKGLFRYEVMWSRDPRFAELIREQWSSLNHCVNIVEKLESLKGPISRWNRKVFGNVHTRLKNIRQELERVRQLPRTVDTVSKEADLVHNMDEWCLREELMWQQRSRVLWLKEGDNNTRFFHQKATARRRTNLIAHLRNSSGFLCDDSSSIKQVAVDYFQNIFKATNHLPNEAMSSLIDVVPRKITDAHNAILTEPYSEREIFTALSQISPSKAPGLDGFPADFFQKYWNVVKTDFLASCLAVLNDGIIPPNFNDTLIVLIPKQKNQVERMEDLRPISLTKVIARVAAKAMVNRLQRILTEVISLEQTAFLKSRSITDNFIIDHECSHFIKNIQKGKSVYGSLKLDMSKAYDRVEWNFLKGLFLQLGFDRGWVEKTLNYITSVRYCIRVNEAITDFIVPE
ncbi:hypothetical protein QQ045_020879 [Rhodiola kirilowii]